MQCIYYLRSQHGSFVVALSHTNPVPVGILQFVFPLQARHVRHSFHRKVYMCWPQACKQVSYS